MIHRKILGLIVGIVAAFVLLPALISTDASAQGVMNPTWDGKAVTWTAVEEATGYHYKCTVGSVYSTEGDVTDTSADMTEFIENCFADGKSYQMGFSFEVKPIKAGEQINSEEARIHLNMIEVRVDTIDVAGNTSYSDSTGGTVSGEGFSQRKKGLFYGIFPDGQKISVTATPEEGYQFKQFGGVGVLPETETVNPMTQTIGDSGHRDYVRFQELVKPLSIKLDIGEKGEPYAEDVCAELNKKFSGAGATATGSVIAFSVPNNKTEASIISDLSEMFRTVPMSGRPVIDDEAFSSYVGLKASYSSYDEYAQSAASTKLITENEMFYALWFTKVDIVEATLAAPVCGTKVTMDEETEEFTNLPKLEYTKASHAEPRMFLPFWYKDGEPFYNAAFKGGETYTVAFMPEPAFGYYYTGDLKVKINGENANIDRYEYPPDSGHYVLERVSFDIKAVHNWGAWKQTKAPTTTKEGEEARTCKYCGAKETRPIPKLKPAKENVFTEANIPARTMKMTWKKTKGAVGYKVAYRERGGKWTKKTVKKTSYTIEGMKKNKFYEFKVAPIVKKGKKKVTGKYKDISYRYFNAVKGKAKGVKGGVKLSWTKESKAKGYIVYCSTSKKMKKYKEVTLKGKNKKSYTFKGLKKGKTYYVMVRSYIKKGGKKYLGVTCTIRKVKAK